MSALLQSLPSGLKPDVVFGEVLSALLTTLVVYVGTLSYQLVLRKWPVRVGPETFAVIKLSLVTVLKFALRHLIRVVLSFPAIAVLALFYGTLWGVPVAYFLRILFRLPVESGYHFEGSVVMIAIGLNALLLTIKFVVAGSIWSLVKACGLNIVQTASIVTVLALIVLVLFDYRFEQTGNWWRDDIIMGGFCWWITYLLWKSYVTRVVPVDIDDIEFSTAELQEIETKAEAAVRAQTLARYGVVSEGGDQAEVAR